MSEVDWASLLVEGDVEGLWNGLFQLVTRHPAVRPLRFATDGAAVASQVEINADLTQELFLELFQKQRFDHYADNEYSSTDIENELARAGMIRHTAGDGKQRTKQTNEFDWHEVS